MEILLLVLLMLCLAALYLPGIFRERALESPLDTVSDFRRGMLALATSTRESLPKERKLYYYRTDSGDPEPYVRRSTYAQDPYDEDGYEEDFIPYPSNKARVITETRRQRVMVTLVILSLFTGILTLFKGLRSWIIPVHIVILVLLASYFLLVVFLPYYESRYR